MTKTKVSEHLHELIHSLNPAEKRYFKLFTERHQSKGKTNYLKIFELIDKQEVYDEEKVLLKFKDSDLTNNFPITKNRLYNHILKSLDAFHAASSVDAELYSTLHYAEILIGKALYDQSGRILKRAQSTALKNEKWGIVLQIIKLQKRLAEITQYSEDNNEGVISLYEKEIDIARKITVESELWKSKSTVFSRLFARGQVRNKEEIEYLLPEVERVAAYSEDDGARSFEAAYLINHTQSAFYFAIGDYAKSHVALTKNARLIEDNLDLIKDEPSTYISVLTNLIYVSAKLNIFEDVDKFLERSRNLPAKLSKSLTDDIKLRIFINTYSLELAICNILGDVKRGKEVISEIQSALPKWDTQVSQVRKASFYHGISTMHFIAGEFSQALKWNNEIINSISIDETEDQYFFARMFHLLIHIELGNYDIIPHNLKSLSRYFDIRNRRFKFESIYTEFIKEVYRTENEEERIELIHRFAEAIKPLENDPYEKVVFESFDFLAWAESKLEKKSLADTLRNRAPSKNVL